MPFTERSDLYGAVSESGFNRFLTTLQQQRPSLFHHATQAFIDQPSLLCRPVVIDPAVRDAGDPVVSLLDPLPVIHTDPPEAVDWCIQLTDVVIDLHPGGVIELPPELPSLAEQHFALRLAVCVGMNCARNVLRVPNSEVLSHQEHQALPDPVVVPPLETPGPWGDWAGSGVRAAAAPATSGRTASPAAVQPLMVDRILCACLQVYALGHLEWGQVGFDDDQYLKFRLDGLEIVDLATDPPSAFEEIVECYLEMVLGLGILPNLMQPMEAFVLDVTGELLEWNVTIAERISLQPTPTSGRLPHNPAIEHDEVRGYIDLVIDRG